MEFWSFGERYKPQISTVSQIVLIRGKGGNPPSEVYEILLGEFFIFLFSGGNLTRSDFGHSNLFQSRM